MCLNSLNVNYGNNGCQVSEGGIENYVNLWPKIFIVIEGYYSIFLSELSKSDKSDFQSQFSLSLESSENNFCLKNLFRRIIFDISSFIIIRLMFFLIESFHQKL